MTIHSDTPAELYFSVDIEATGPIPGPYSMSSFGATLAAVRIKSGEIVRPTTEATFYSKLAPLEALASPESAAMPAEGATSYVAHQPRRRRTRAKSWALRAQLKAHALA